MLPGFFAYLVLMGHVWQLPLSVLLSKKVVGVIVLLPTAGAGQGGEHRGNLHLLPNAGMAQAFALMYSELGEPMALAGRLCYEFLQTGTPLSYSRERRTDRNIAFGCLLFRHSTGNLVKIEPQPCFSGGWGNKWQSPCLTVGARSDRKCSRTITE